MEKIHGKHPWPTQYFNNFGYFNIIMWVYSGRHIGLPLRLSYSFVFLWTFSGGTHKGCPYGNFSDFFLVFTNKIVSLR